ncbi:unnamed protein product, partial [Prorocentrum cordatum]
PQPLARRSRRGARRARRAPRGAPAGRRPAPPLASPRAPCGGHMRWRLPWALLALLCPSGGVTESELPGPTPSSGDELLCKLKRSVNFRDMFGVHKWNSPRLFAPNPTTTCAVVSSSGVLRVKEHGPEIDAADRIFRFNQAETKGWEEYVGYRKDVTIWNDIALLKHEDAWETHAGGVYVQFLKFDEELEKATALRKDDDDGVTFLIVWPNSLESAVREFFATTYPEEWFPKHVKSVFNPDQGDADSDELKQRFAPSTGVMGMLLALTMCGEVRTYGMAASKAELDDTLPYHYWDEDAKGGANAHTNNFHVTISAEKDLWRRLSSTPESVIDETATAVIPGFSAVDCASFDGESWPPELEISPFGSSFSFRGGRTGKFCTDAGDDGVMCLADSAGDMEKFVLVNAGSGKVALAGPKKNKYCTLAFEEDALMKCNVDSIGGSRETWILEDAGLDENKLRQFTLKGGDGQDKYCADTGEALKCDRDQANSSEKFWLEAVEDTLLSGLSEARRRAGRGARAGRPPKATAWRAASVRVVRGGGGGGVQHRIVKRQSSVHSFSGVASSCSRPLQLYQRDVVVAVVRFAAIHGRAVDH